MCPHCGYVEGTPPAQAYYLAPGTVLENRYIIGPAIGFGGFGITYRAFDMVLGILVAVKEFYPAGLVNRSPGETKVGIFSGEKEAEFQLQMERFLDEARNMAIFTREKDIVNVYHFFQANGTAYTIMEYIDGVLLKKYLKENGKMSVEEAVSYMLPILDALTKIHGHDIIHKDISPDNIFLTGEGSVKVFDFGAARFPKGQQEKTFSVIVKSGYAPPEQYRSGCRPGAFMDIYAAGAVFYEMITGVRPGEGSDRMVEDDLKLPSELGIKIDWNLEKIIMKALAVKPEQRFQTAEEFKSCIVENTEVLLPEEELKKRAVKKAVKLGIGAAVAAAIAIGGIAGALAYMGRDKLQPNRIKEDAVSLWLPVEESPGEKNGTAKMLKESFQKSCPRVTLEITQIPEEEYAEKLEDARVNGTLPDVFCTDYLKGEKGQYCGSVRKLYNTLDMEEYPYLDENKGSCEVPTGFQVAIAYENYEKFLNQKLKLDDRLTLGKLEELPAGKWAVEGKYEDFGNEESPVRVIAGDISCFPEIQAVTVQAIPSVEFQAVPIETAEGELAAAYCRSYGVNRQSSENRQDAGLVCISYLLNENIQEEEYFANYRGLPIQKDALEKYKEVKLTGYLEFVTEYLDKLSFSDETGSIREIYLETEVKPELQEKNK